MSNNLSCLIVNAQWLLSQCRGIWPRLGFICGTRRYFLVRLPHGPSILVSVFLRTLWSSIMELKTPFLFELEHGIVLYAMSGDRASSRGEEEVSLFLSNCGGNVGYYIDLWWKWPFQTLVCSATSGHLFSCKGHVGILLEAWQVNTHSSRIEVGHPGFFSSCLSHTGILINFQGESGLVSF